jgi:sulfatase maturation enzyme AslB (radical SAM superfamily)
MESIYYVMSWLCHRRCVHCYEERFRPYSGEELQGVVEEAVRCFPRIIENLPPRMTFLDTAEPLANGQWAEKRGRMILAGGEILLKPVREPVLYPALETLHEKYRAQGGVDLIVQTTGDVINDRIVDELLTRHVKHISVSGMDAYHEGLEADRAREDLRRSLTKIFESHGMEHSESIQPQRVDEADDRRYFSFFGATPDSWIGSIWPRGRAQENELSSATLADNFCNRWSGGLNFLQYRHNGSEVSVEPNGNVYPCCIKTRAPIGNLTEEPLEAILERHTGNPVYEAISMGHPERMGIAAGWTVETFLEKSTMTLPSGRVYQNLCIGCDRFHEEMLLRQQNLVTIR